MANPFIHDNHPVLYIIRCLVNNKVYVGSTEYRTDRFRTHRNKFKCGNGINQEIQSDWDLYGADQFEFVVLEWFRDGIDSVKLKSLEADTCNTYDAYNPDKGYNTNNPLTRKRIRPWSSKPGKQILLLSNTDNSIQYTFPGVAECAKELNFNQKYIRKAANYWPNKDRHNVEYSKSYKGYIFVYEIDYDSNFNYSTYKKPRAIRPKKDPKIKPPRIPKEKPINIPGNRKQISLKNIETGEEIIFDSIKDACKKLKLVRGKVKKCLDNEFGKYSTHGFHIRYTGVKQIGMSIYSDKIVYRE